MSIWVIFKLLGSLALLMFGMKSMSEALQKMAGPQLRYILSTMTTNRFTGVLTGLFVTAAVQSSTATTLMTVSFVNAGLLTLMQAIAVIMGAHIGTTVTAWIMSLVFSFNVAAVIYPALLVGIILIYRKKRRIVGDFLFGAAFLFLGLMTLKNTSLSLMEDAQTYDAIKGFFISFNDLTFWNSFLFLMIGTVLTLCVQSSAAIMAITMVLCATGILHIDQGILLVMGQNIGTTITANIAAFNANTSARRAAFAHFTINMVGVILGLLLLRPFFGIICQITGFDPAMNPQTEGFAFLSAIVLATFHSAFNILNTLLMLGFVPLIERFVCWVIQPKQTDDEEEFRLQFITTGIMKTPELSVLEAQKEIRSFAERMQQMFGMVRDLVTENDENAFAKGFARIEKYEAFSDSMEIEIARYLNDVSDAHLSDETKAKMRAMLREISELESIGDACYNIARTLNRRIKGKEDFTESQYEHMHQMMGLVNQALTQMNATLVGYREQNDVNRSFNIENEINNYRNQLKSQNINDVNKHAYTYAIGTMYMDIIGECEKLADYVVNVVEARMGTRQKEV
ncbi:MAG: Na/Pi cotransporter family protein [Prevotella sp.]|nr:Na/Pi cotransporter family protein [Prevotella sp.]